VSDNATIRDTFFEECEDLLEALGDGLSEMYEGDHSPDTVNSVFRAVHSIKGGAGAFGLEDLVKFSHTFETVLDEIRGNRLTATETLMGQLLRASDCLAGLVEASRDDTPIDHATCEGVLEELTAHLGDVEEEEISFQPAAFGGLVDLSIEISTDSEYAIQFKPLEKLFYNGHDPLFLFQELNTLGELTVTLEESKLPELVELDPFKPYLSWEIKLKTPKSLERINTVFEFVEGLCELEIHELTSASVDTLPLIAIEEDVVSSESNEVSSQDEIEKKPDELKPEIQAESKEDVKQAPEEAPLAKGTTEKKETSGGSKGPKQTLRVDPDRVDRLINTVGELIINQAMLSQRFLDAQNYEPREVESHLEGYKMLARALQEEVMGIRAQPVKPLFQRMARIVREATAATGKKAKLVMDGEGTEVDKTLIERLADPLTHMIRNAVDHGLESNEDRAKTDKPETGEIRLSAAHRSGSVFISVSDDGAGLNRAKIKEIAVSKGLIPKDAELQESEVDNLLFMPGFSTATEVSNLSGRGVGMDVVKNAVTSLGGRISITSVPGSGTTFSIVLPLTLAVLDGMVVQVESQTMVVPITSIVETIRAEPEKTFNLGDGDPVYEVRGNYIPVIDVAWSLGLSSDHNSSPPNVLLLVDTEAIGTCALAVDGLSDQRQVVIKSLDGVYSGAGGVSAATILGDGKIALILDPESLAVMNKASLGTSSQETDDGERKIAS
jgi:two-component system chemotaxis sensor kinase CheA